MSYVPRLPAQSPVWTAARWVVLLVTVALIGAFFLWPEWSLRVLWYALIPVLPAAFLVNVELWRNVCPLATLNMLGGHAMGSRKLERAAARVTVIVGITLLVAMVPARRFLYNTDGAWLGVTVIAVGVLAVLGGLLFDMKAGFCNALCPVLPVERLYGQRPLLRVSNARCTPCTLCTRAACLDLSPQKSALMTLGSGRKSRRWMLSAYGVFALAFPGFVVAYYLLADVSIAQAPAVYGQVALWSVGSWVALSVGFTLLHVSTERALVVCGGLAVGVYYWFAPPGIASTFGLPTGFTWGLRLLTLTLVGFWLVRGLSTPMNGAPTRAKASGA